MNEEKKMKSIFPGNAAREADARPVRRVYGVYGLTEWVALIRAGNAKIRIPFEGGAISSLGVVPATFETCDRGVAALVEGSEYFRSGRVVRIS